MKVTKILAAMTTAVVAASALAATASAYNGYINWQSSSYSFRNDWNDGAYGQATPYFNSAVVWGSGDAPEETYPDYADNFDWDINGYVLDANYTDTTINGDGTYTVTAEGDFWAVDGATAFNLIGVSTDIPIDAGATITNLKIIVDGVETASIDAPACEGSEYLKINGVNIWNTDVPSYTGAYPTSTLAVEFTVEGLGAADTGAADTDANAGADTSVDAGATTGKDSPDTGVEGVAVVAAAAIVAGGALVLSKKRK